MALSFLGPAFSESQIAGARLQLRTGDTGASSADTHAATARRVSPDSIAFAGSGIVADRRPRRPIVSEWRTHPTCAPEGYWVLLFADPTI